MPETLRPVLDIELDGQAYRLAKNGEYSLHIPLPADPFGVVAHAEVAPGLPTCQAGTDTWGKYVAPLLQLYGAAVEENERLKAALQKGG